MSLLSLLDSLDKHGGSVHYRDLPMELRGDPLRFARGKQLVLLTAPPPWDKVRINDIDLAAYGETEGAGVTITLTEKGRVKLAKYRLKTAKEIETHKGGRGKPKGSTASRTPRPASVGRPGTAEMGTTRRRRWAAPIPKNVCSSTTSRAFQKSET